MRSLKNKEILLLFLLITVFSGCTHMRTEFYREETKHLYEAACLSYKQGDYDTARSTFEEIIALDPDYGPAYSALGNLAMIEEGYEEAYMYYQQAIDHDPELMEKLLPFLMTSEMHKVRRPLTNAGIELSTVFPLMMDEKFDELEALFEKEVPLELLAKDTVSLTPGQIGALRQKAAEIALQAEGSVSYRLFLSYLLFYSGQYDQQNYGLLSSLIKDAKGTALQDGNVLMGRLCERAGDNNEAVSYLLAAVDAGMPLAEVAHHLARIYRVDIATILPSEETAITIAGQVESTPFITESTGPEDIEQSDIQLEKAVLVIRKPQAKLISKPE